MTSRGAREGTFPEGAASVKALPDGGGSPRRRRDRRALRGARAEAAAPACTPARALQGAPWRFASRAASA
ncbi:hypothetical protein AB3662_21775 [Sorangium cellulosum]|uniref:hypothetical protein n=1 Tax=Sorangium cellulosum TaxID=56 RepID=UPI003D9A13F3